MTSPTIRTSLFLLGLCVLGVATGLQVARSVPHATVFYVVGLALMFTVLQPLVGLIVYLAFYYIKLLWLVPGFGSFPLMLIVGGSTFVSMLIRQAVEQRRVSLLKSPSDYLLMWFLLAIAFSHLANARITEAITATYGFLHCVVVYLLITNLLSDVRRLSITIHCLAIFIFWVAVEALIVHYRGVGIGGVEPIQGRATALGFGGDPNTLAGGLLLLAPLFFLQIIRRGRLARRVGAAVGLGVLCYATVLTESRGGAITLGVISMVVLVRRTGLRRGLFLGLVVGSAIYLLGPSRFQELNPKEASTFGRLIAWKRAFAEFHSSPLFGIGSKMSGGIGEAVPHNGFMQAAAELGMFGLVPLILFILVSVKNAIFVSKLGGIDRFARLALLSEASCYAYLVWVITLLSVGSPFYPELFIVAALCVSAANIFVRSTESRYVLMEKRDFAYAIVLIAMGLGAHRLVLLVVGL